MSELIPLRALPKSSILDRNDDDLLVWVSKVCPSIQPYLDSTTTNELRKIIDSSYRPDLSELYRQPFPNDFALLDSHTPTKAFNKFLIDRKGIVTLLNNLKIIFAGLDKYLPKLLGKTQNQFRFLASEKPNVLREAQNRLCIGSIITILYTKGGLERAKTGYIRRMGEAINPENELPFGLSIHFDLDIPFVGGGLADASKSYLEEGNLGSMYSLKKCITKGDKFALVSWGVLIDDNPAFGEKRRSGGYTFNMILDFERRLIYVFDTGCAKETDFVEMVLQPSVRAILKRYVDIDFTFRSIYPKKGGVLHHATHESVWCVAWSIYIIILFVLADDKGSFLDTVYGILSSYSPKERDRFIIRFLFWIDLLDIKVNRRTPEKPQNLPTLYDLFV